MIPGQSNFFKKNILVKEEDNAQDFLSEEKLKMVLEAAYDGLWDLNLEKNTAYYSPKFFSMLGYDSKDFHHEIFLIEQLLHPEDLHKIMNTLLDFMGNTDKSLEYEMRLRKKDGSYSWILSRGKVFKSDVSGKPLRIVGTHTDITQRKKHESIQNTLFGIANAVNTTRNLDELFLSIQQTLGSIIDTKNCYVALYDEANDSFSLPFHKDEKDSFTVFPAGKTLTAFVIKTGKAQLVNKSRAEQLENEKIIESIGAPSESWLGVPLKNNKKVIGVFAVQSYDPKIIYTEEDVQILEFVSDQIALAIERKSYETNLEIAKTKAEEADRLKTAFLSNMSHEIRTPMNAIIGFAELLALKDVTDDEKKEFIQQINHGAETLMHLIDDIIDISKIEAGQLVFHNSEFLLSEFLNELKLIYNKSLVKLNKNNIRLSENNNNFPVHIYLHTDKYRLKQIFTNLLGNALKFTEKGTITFGIKHMNNNIISFYVKDTGIGITREKLSLIFERFRQGHDSSAKLYSGTGLGLAISKNLIELMGGKIDVISTPGEGTEFEFSIPLQYSLSKLL